MKPFTQHDGLVAPMDRANVDTDLMVPKQFLKSIRRSGFGPNLFDELRYFDEGEPDSDNSQRPLNPEFPLNQARYQGASILLARENFGCGSSREHAAWAMEDFGFRAVIAPTFATFSALTRLKTVFYQSCYPRLRWTSCSLRCMQRRAIASLSIWRRAHCCDRTASRGRLKSIRFAVIVCWRGLMTSASRWSAVRPFALLRKGIATVFRGYLRTSCCESDGIALAG